MTLYIDSQNEKAIKQMLKDYFNNELSFNDFIKLIRLKHILIYTNTDKKEEIIL